MEEYVLDLTVISIVLGFAIMGFVSGFSGRVLSLMSWGFSLILAFFLFEPLATWGGMVFPGLKSSPTVTHIGAFLVVFLFFLVIFSFFAKMVSSGIKKSKLGTLDRNLGLLLGGITGVFFLSVLVLGGRFVLKAGTPPPFVSKSKFYPWLELCSDQLCSFAPLSFHAPQEIADDQEKMVTLARQDAATKLATLTLTKPVVDKK